MEFSGIIMLPLKDHPIKYQVGRENNLCFRGDFIFYTHLGKGTFLPVSFLEGMRHAEMQTTIIFNQLGVGFWHLYKISSISTISF